MTSGANTLLDYSQKQNALNYRIVEAVHEIFAQLLDRMWPSFLNISQKILITQRNSQSNVSYKVNPLSKMLFSLP